MTKREAKIEALRICTALINAGVTFDDNESEEYIRKVTAEMEQIAESLRIRAVKMGGDFNNYTGTK